MTYHYLSDEVEEGVKVVIDMFTYNTEQRWIMGKKHNVCAMSQNTGAVKKDIFFRYMLYNGQKWQPCSGIMVRLAAVKGDRRITRAIILYERQKPCDITISRASVH